MNRRIKNTLITLAFPVLMFLIMEAVCLIAAGRHVIDFSTNLDLVNLVRNTGIACAITYALSFNLTSGRLDLSLGAQRLAGTVAAGGTRHADVADALAAALAQAAPDGRVLAFGSFHAASEALRHLNASD